MIYLYTLTLLVQLHGLISEYRPDVSRSLGLFVEILL